jgi:hypothetical protein
VSIRSKPIQAVPFKRSYVPHPSEGHYTDAELLARRAKTALAHGARWFDYKGETYVWRGGMFVPWCKG